MTYRLAHLSDLHADYRSSRKINSLDINVREADGYLAIRRTVKSVIEAKVDGVVIAGDIFHTPTPSIRAIVFVQNQLRKFWAANIPVYMLAGNHDTNDIQSDIAASKILNDPWRKIYSHVEPYSHHEIADGIHLHIVSHHMYSEQSGTMNQVKPVPGEINIFSTHGSCIDPIIEMKLKAEASPREIVIPDFLIKEEDWSYSILGHIHERGWVGSEDKLSDTNNSKIYYNGSLIRRGFSDKEVPLGRGWTLWEIESDGTFTPTSVKIPQRPQFDFPTIDAKTITPNEVSEKVIENLVNTQVNGNSYDVSVAPILRQKIINITGPEYLSIDSKNINREAEHSLHWDLKPYIIDVADEDSNRSLEDEENSELANTDVVEVYKQWIDNSEYLNKHVTDKHKPDVQKKAQDFIDQGQNIILEEE